MLSLMEIQKLRSLLLSDRITYKGSELDELSALLAALKREENAHRLRPAMPPRPQEPPAGAKEG